jgi:hypothetical protein
VLVGSPCGDAAASACRSISILLAQLSFVEIASAMSGNGCMGGHRGDGGGFTPLVGALAAKATAAACGGEDSRAALAAATSLSRLLGGGSGGRGGSGGGAGEGGRDHPHLQRVLAACAPQLGAALYSAVESLGGHRSGCGYRHRLGQEGEGDRGGVRAGVHHGQPVGGGAGGGGLPASLVVPATLVVAALAPYPQLWGAQLASTAAVTALADALMTTAVGAAVEGGAEAEAAAAAALAAAAIIARGGATGRVGNALIDRQGAPSSSLYSYAPCSFASTSEGVAARAASFRAALCRPGGLLRSALFAQLGGRGSNSRGVGGGGGGGGGRGSVGGGVGGGAAHVPALWLLTAVAVELPALGESESESESEAGEWKAVLAAVVRGVEDFAAVVVGDDRRGNTGWGRSQSGRHLGAADARAPAPTPAHAEEEKKAAGTGAGAGCLTSKKAAAGGAAAAAAAAAVAAAAALLRPSRCVFGAAAPAPPPWRSALLSAGLAGSLLAAAGAVAAAGAGVGANTAGCSLRHGHSH